MMQPPADPLPSPQNTTHNTLCYDWLLARQHLNQPREEPEEEEEVVGFRVLPNKLNLSLLPLRMLAVGCSLVHGQKVGMY